MGSVNIEKQFARLQVKFSNESVFPISPYLKAIANKVIKVVGIQELTERAREQSQLKGRNKYAMTRNWGNQNLNSSLKTKTGNNCAITNSHNSKIT